MELVGGRTGIHIQASWLLSPHSYPGVMATEVETPRAPPRTISMVGSTKPSQISTHLIFCTVPFIGGKPRLRMGKRRAQAALLSTVAPPPQGPLPALPPHGREQASFAPLLARFWHFSAQLPFIEREIYRAQTVLHQAGPSPGRRS